MGSADKFLSAVQEFIRIYAYAYLGISLNMLIIKYIRPLFRVSGFLPCVPEYVRVQDYVYLGISWKMLIMMYMGPLFKIFEILK